MNKNQLSICASLRDMTSQQAASFLLDEFTINSNNWGEALLFIAHRSWKKEDQIRLAEYYLQKIPYANSSGYKAFLSFMSLINFVIVVKRHTQTDKAEKDMLAYHLLPLLYKKADTEKDRNIVTELKELIS